MPYPNLLAEGITAEDPFTPFQLYAGSADIVTDQAVAGEAIPQFAVVGRVTATGKIMVHDPAAVDGSEKACGIAAQAFAGDNSEGPIYTGGDFNHEALGWDATLDTLGERKAAFAGTNINVKKLL